MFSRGPRKRSWQEGGDEIKWPAKRLHVSCWLYELPVDRVSLGLRSVIAPCHQAKSRIVPASRLFPVTA
jgi:hypothetical protein